MSVPMNRKSADIAHLGLGVQFVYLDSKHRDSKTLATIQLYYGWPECIYNFHYSNGVPAMCCPA